MMKFRIFTALAALAACGAPSARAELSPFEILAKLAQEPPGPSRDRHECAVAAGGATEGGLLIGGVICGIASIVPPKEPRGPARPAPQVSDRGEACLEAADPDSDVAGESFQDETGYGTRIVTSLGN